MPPVTLPQLKALVRGHPGRRLLGLDVGTTYIGLAISDAACARASPLSVVQRTPRRPVPLDSLLPSQTKEMQELALAQAEAQGEEEGNGSARSSSSGSSSSSSSGGGVGGGGNGGNGGERRVSLTQLVRSVRPLGLVIGFPLELQGTQSSVTVRQFVGSELRASSSSSPSPEALGLLPYVLWDERYSSTAAEGLLQGLELEHAEAKRITDKASAVHILQGCLDAMAQLD